MSHAINLSERAERLLAALAAGQEIAPDEYLSRFVEAWAAQLSEGPHDREQAWFWTPEWQAGERAADADLAAGRSTSFQNNEDLLWALEQHREGTAGPAEVEGR